MTDQKTFTSYDGESNHFDAVTISTYCCPHCRTPVRFVVPDQGSDLKSTRQELEHYKKLCRSLSKDNYDLRMFCKRLASQS